MRLDGAIYNQRTTMKIITHFHKNSPVIYLTAQNCGDYQIS